MHFLGDLVELIHYYVWCDSLEILVSQNSAANAKEHETTIEWSTTQQRQNSLLPLPTRYAGRQAKYDLNFQSKLFFRILWNIQELFPIARDGQVQNLRKNELAVTYADRLYPASLNNLQDAL